MTGTVHVTDTGAGAAANAMIDAQSTTRGVYIPRMTGTQRDAISSPAEGLLIYNTTTDAFNYHTGSAWVAIGSSAGSSPAFTTSAGLAALLSDETGTGAAVFGSSPTIVTPTIASFTNATHSHQNAAGGGTLDGAAIAAGTVAIARLPAAVNRTLFVQTASASATNTTSDTSLVSTGSGSITLSANTLAVGTWLRLSASGFYGTLSSTPGGCRHRFKVGGATILDDGSVSPTANLTNRGWTAEITVICRTAGASGTIFSQGIINLQNANGGAQQRELVATATSTVDTTGTLALDFTWTWATADATNTATLTNLILTQGGV